MLSKKGSNEKKKKKKTQQRVFNNWRQKETGNWIDYEIDRSAFWFGKSASASLACVLMDVSIFVGLHQNIINEIWTMRYVYVISTGYQRCSEWQIMIN